MPAALRRVVLTCMFALFACRGQPQPQSQQVSVSVSGMTCEACVQAIEHTVGKLEGVSSCKVDLAGEKATVVFQAGEIEPAQIVAAIEKLGYEAEAGSVEPLAGE